MIHIDVTLNGATVKKQVKTEWSELTFDEFLRTLNLSSITDVLSFALDIDKDTLRKSTITGLEVLMIAVEYLQTPPEFTTHPQIFMGEIIPDDITQHPMGPYIDCRHILHSTQGKDMKEFVAEYPKYCAIYVQAIREDYDYDKAMKLIPEVMQQPAGEVVGLASFFITRLLPPRTNTTPNSLKAATPPKKSKRGTKS